MWYNFRQWPRLFRNIPNKPVKSAKTRRRRFMKIVQLEYFCMVSHYHSITQAAQKLYVTQPAISNAIKELEKEFSVSLFVRSKII
ncbi:MAG: LysR family transcriptional regulator [Clostridium sp.]